MHKFEVHKRVVVDAIEVLPNMKTLEKAGYYENVAGDIFVG